MAQPFSLFPRSGVPKLSQPDPHKRQPSLHAPKGIYDNKTGKNVPLPNGGAIPLQDRAPSRSRTPSAENIGVAVTTLSPVDGATPSPIVAVPPTRVPMTPPPPPPPPPAKAYSPRIPSSGRSGSVTLVSADNRSPTTPIVPFRSMFPTYNPRIPLNQQNYYPQRSFPGRSSSLYSRNVSRQEYRDSIATPIDRQLGYRTAPPSVINFNDAASIVATPVISSQRELETLWAASHGTEPNMLIKTFDLEMARTSEATFTFGTDPQFPFYTLKTFDTAEISVSKTNPVKRSQVHEIVMCSIEPPARRQPPNDGLVSFIFPKMAAMLALNQSAELAKAHHLAPTDKDELEASAIRRAAAQEACHLRWNSTHLRYELEHPAVARRGRDPNFLKSPVSDDGSMMLRIHDPMMHISISSPTPDSSPIINIINPNAVGQTGTPQTSAGAGIRLSTIPQSDSDPSLSRPLASLDLNTQSLHIDADQILTLMPSLSSIDSIVCALFAVAIADESTNPVLGNLPTWTPRPKAPMSQYGGSVKSYAGSQYFATLAEREEAEGEAREMAREFKKDLKDNKSRKISSSPLSSVDEKGDTEALEGGKRGRTWYGARRKRSRSRERKNNRTKKVVIGEFDLEKMGRYQAGQREGQELPAPVRWFMEVLVAILRMVTWTLTTIVSIICWVLVRLTRCVTSERF